MTPVRIFNTMTRRKEELVPLTPGEIRMYVCGVTPYDFSHVGHARAAIVFDVIRRYLAFKGCRVTLVRNYTDVDDKIIRRASQEGVAPSEISERYIAAEREDMAAIGVLPADVAPRATEHIPEMIALIERLLAAGTAYVVDGDVYFEVARYPAYGRLSGKNLEELLAGARVEVDERKRDPRDFALWKAGKPGEPTWESPWGPGRPGWHIECSAMAMRYLGETFDIHGGGEDLVFPHHECEIAQSEAATGRPFSRYWLHNAFIIMGAEKMSKSLGNTLTIREIVKRHDPEALRLWLLGAHYRHPIGWSEDRVDESARALERLRGLVLSAERLAGSGGGWYASGLQAGATGAWLAAIGDGALIRPAAACVDRFVSAMDDDFNTAGAVGALFDLSHELYRYRDAVERGTGQPAAFASGVRVLTQLASGPLGLLQGRPAAAGPPPALGAMVERLVAERQEARRQRNFERADELRDAIRRLGATVEDTPSGPQVRWVGDLK